VFKCLHQKCLRGVRNKLNGIIGRRRRSDVIVCDSDRTPKTVSCLWNIRLGKLKTSAQLRKISSAMISSRKRVAIIGGGVTGSCAANHLISSVGDSCDVDVVLFDQGGRGPGGRTSHRRVCRNGEFISLLQIVTLVARK
jgi:NAD(P)-binding Rossmann-like domain